jgi:hypothetical protein
VWRYLFGRDGSYVSVTVSFRTESFAIDDGGILSDSRRFPLVVPDGFETFGSSFQTNTEATDTGE